MLRGIAGQCQARHCNAGLTISDADPAARTAFQRGAKKAMTRKLIIFVTVWMTCAALSSGFMNANFRAEFPRLLQSPRWAGMHRNESVMFGVLTGPIGLGIAALFSGGFYDGWTLRGDAVPCANDRCEP
jgi:hypothetical protein